MLVKQSNQTISAAAAATKFNTEKSADIIYSGCELKAKKSTHTKRNMSFQ